jgi:hypothetical protein
VPVQHRPGAERAALTQVEQGCDRLRRVHRVELQALVPARILPRALGGRRAVPVTGAQPGTLGVEVARADRESPMSAPRASRSARARFASRATVRASVDVRSFTTTPTTRERNPAMRRPATSPAAVPPEPSATTTWEGSGSSPASTCPASSRAASTYPRQPSGDDPPTVRKYGSRRERSEVCRNRIHGAARYVR